MPDRYQPQNADMESQVSSRGVKLPPHAHLTRASNSGGREQEGNSSGGALAQLQRQLERADQDLKAYMRLSAAQEVELKREVDAAEVRLAVASQRVVSICRVLFMLVA
jgi:hypothetical protein